MIGQNSPTSLETLLRTSSRIRECYIGMFEEVRFLTMTAQLSRCILDVCQENNLFACIPVGEIAVFVVCWEFGKFMRPISSKCVGIRGTLIPNPLSYFQITDLDLYAILAQAL